MTAVIWSPQALLDLQSIRDYIAHDLASLRRLGGAPPGRGTGEIGSVYRLPGVAEIVTVFRASRLFPEVT